MVSKNRDDNLDTVRAVSIIWVLLTHCIWWTGLFNSNSSIVIVSMLLLEMPLVFFVAGAGNSLASKKTIFDFYKKRLSRILIPYWIFALISVFIITITALITSVALPANFIQSWIFPFTAPYSNHNFLTWALWFIPIYLFVMILFPFIKNIYEKFKLSKLKYIPVVFAALYLLSLDTLFGLNSYSFERNIIFYSIWIYIGLFYSQANLILEAKYKIKQIILSITCLLISAALVVVNIYPANMQINKFPPNFIFLLYTLGALTLLYVFSKYILDFIKKIKDNNFISWLLNQYSEKGYTIYLFHPFSFLIIGYVLNSTGIIYPLLSYKLLILLIYFVLTVIISAVLAVIFGWCENINFSKIFRDIK